MNHKPSPHHLYFLFLEFQKIVEIFEEFLNKLIILKFEFYLPMKLETSSIKNLIPDDLKPSRTNI